MMSISLNPDFFIFLHTTLLNPTYQLNQHLMCLAIPGKLIERIEAHGEHGLAMGVIDINGAAVRACLAYVPDIAVGQYTIVHAGFALKILDEEEAMESLKLWQELSDKGAFQPLDDANSSTQSCL